MHKATSLASIEDKTLKNADESNYLDKKKKVDKYRSRNRNENTDQHSVSMGIF